MTLWALHVGFWKCYGKSVYSKIQTLLNVMEKSISKHLLNMCSDGLEGMGDLGHALALLYGP